MINKGERFLELEQTKNKKQNANKKRRRENPLFRKRDHHINHGKNVILFQKCYSIIPVKSIKLTWGFFGFVCFFVCHSYFMIHTTSRTQLAM